jgi:hypothetical protein
VIDFQDWMRLLISGGLSAALVMGFWVLWLKTRNASFKLLAYFVGLSPIVFTTLVIVGRLLFASGTVNSFETGAKGPGAGEKLVERKLVFPVMQPELRQVVEVRPVLEGVVIQDPDHEVLEVRRSVREGVLTLEFEGRKAGTHLVVMQIPAGVERVGVVSREVR